MAISSSSEKATSAFASTHLLLRSVKLRGCEFFSASLVRYNALLYLLVVSSNSKNLPRSYDTVVKSIHHMEDISAAKTHFTFLWLLVMKMSPMQKYTSILIKPKKLTLIEINYIMFFFKYIYIVVNIISIRRL